MTLSMLNRNLPTCESVRLSVLLAVRLAFFPVRGATSGRARLRVNPCPPFLVEASSADHIVSKTLNTLSSATMLTILLIRSIFRYEIFGQASQVERFDRLLLFLFLRI